jgi:hypothetical protein
LVNQKSQIDDNKPVDKVESEIQGDEIDIDENKDSELIEKDG